ncbi:hypothetical protein [Rhizobium sp. LjRoot254]|uniref:hypothetical protein n=1 Tax=Rhizobium sp. LjRoot254 TaxID=3342297 RepID=UPI003ECDE726
MQSDFRLDQIERSLDDVRGMLIGLARKRDGHKPPVRTTLIRAIAAKALAEVHKISIDEVVKRSFRDDATLRLAVADIGQWHAKATTSPAATSVPGWASELANVDVYTGMMPSLAASSVYTRLAALGLSLTRGAAAGIRLPYPVQPGTVPSPWIGEGQPVPVVGFNITGGMIIPYKTAVMATYTSELATRSVSNFEAVLKQLLDQQTSIALDQTLLDDQPMTATVRPPGLLYGVTATAASAATTAADAAREDIVKLLAAFDPEATLPVAIMGTAQATNFDLLYPQASLPVLTTPVLPTGRVVMVDAADFASFTASDGSIDVSQSATIELRDDPTSSNIMTGTPVTSLWEQDMRAIRLLETLSFAMRRPGRVQFIDSVAW